MPSELNSSPPDPDEDDLREVVSRHSEELLRLPHVVGVGIGTDPESGRPRIVIYTETTGDNHLPETIEGYPITVSRSGPIQLESKTRRRPQCP